MAFGDGVSGATVSARNTAQTGSRVCSARRSPSPGPPAALWKALFPGAAVSHAAAGGQGGVSSDASGRR